MKTIEHVMCHPGVEAADQARTAIGQGESVFWTLQAVQDC